MASEFSEIRISIKDSDQKLLRNFPIYDSDIMISHDDPKLKKLVEDTIKDFKGDRNDCDVTVMIKFLW